jgi:hypothetical protein
VDAAAAAGDNDAWADDDGDEYAGAGGDYDDGCDADDDADNLAAAAAADSMRASGGATPSRATATAARSAAAAPGECPIKLTPESPGARRRTGPGDDDAATEAAAEPDSGTEAVHVAARARASKRSYAAVATPREGRAAKSRKSLAGERDVWLVVAIGNVDAVACVSVTHDTHLAVFLSHAPARLQLSSLLW